MTKDERWLLDEKYAGEESPGYEADKKRLACGEPLPVGLKFRRLLPPVFLLQKRLLVAGHMRTT